MIVGLFIIFSPAFCMYYLSLYGCIRVIKDVYMQQLLDKEKPLETSQGSLDSLATHGLQTQMALMWSVGVLGYNTSRYHSSAQGRTRLLCRVKIALG